MIEKLLVFLRIPLRITLGILTFLFYEAFTEMMRTQESVDAARGDLFAKMEAMKLKFRAERNFYLFAFTFTVFIIILRLDVILNNYRSSKKRVAELEVALAGSKPSAAEKKNQ